MSYYDRELRNGLLQTNSQDSFILEPVENAKLDHSEPTSGATTARNSTPAYREDLNIMQRFYAKVIEPNVGLSLVIMAQFFNAGMNMSCKMLETDPDFEEPMNPFQILFVRMSISFILCMLYMWLQGTPDFPLGPKDMRKWLVLRGFCGFFGVFGVYFSLQYLSVSDATVLVFLSPSITGILAWIFLKERLSRVEVLGGIFSLLGVVMIARPTFLFGTRSTSSLNESVETSDPWKRQLAVLVLLLGTLGAGSVVVVIRFIGRRVHALMSISYYALWCTIVSFVAILVVPSYSFQMPHTARQWFYFSVMGLCGFIMQFAFTSGIQREKAGRTSLMVYTQIVWALIWEVTLFHHWPPLLSWLGFFIIIGSAVCIVYFKPKEPVKEADIELTLTERSAK